MSKDMGGALFVNDKGGNDARPDYRGDVTIGGTKYALAAWKKQGRNGEYLSLSVSEWKEKPASGGGQQRGGGAPDLGGDSIPF